MHWPIPLPLPPSLSFVASEPRIDAEGLFIIYTSAAVHCSPVCPIYFASLFYVYLYHSIFIHIYQRIRRAAHLPGATSPVPNKQDTCREYYTVPSADTLQCPPRRYEPHYHGTDTHIQSEWEKNRRKVTPHPKRVDKWRGRNEMETSRSMKREDERKRGEGAAILQEQNCLRREGKRTGEWERGRGIRRIAFRPCSIKGEITHLLRFFLRTTAPIDQTTGCTSQFSTWNIDTENQFHLCSLPPPPTTPHTIGRTHGSDHGLCLPVIRTLSNTPPLRMSSVCKI